MTHNLDKHANTARLEQHCRGQQSNVTDQSAILHSQPFSSRFLSLLLNLTSNGSYVSTKTLLIDLRATQLKAPFFCAFVEYLSILSNRDHQTRRAELVLQDEGTSHRRTPQPAGFLFPLLFLSCSLLVTARVSTCQHKATDQRTTAQASNVRGPKHTVAPVLGSTHDPDPVPSGLLPSHSTRSAFFFSVKDWKIWGEHAR